MKHELQMAHMINNAADDGGTIQAAAATAIHQADSGNANPERHCPQSARQAAEWIGCTAELETLGWERANA
jgi:hypothetical protein